MPDHFLYLVINAGVLIIPLLVSFHPGLRFYREWKAFGMACALVMCLFIAWDWYFTKAGIWGFNSRYHLGVKFLQLPLEEWLFFICIPYACVFTYYALGLWDQVSKGGTWFRWLAIFSGILFMAGIIFFNQAYTFVTFILFSIMLGYLALVEKPDWLPRAIVTYLLVLPFFFITNGLLTGTCIEEEVVWYNNDENLRIRIGTIPVEDTVYGFLLVLMNIYFFERFRKKENTSPDLYTFNK